MKYNTCMRAAIWLWLFSIATAQDAPAPYLQVPSHRQLEWQKQELYAFLHFGPNTFTGEEWGRSQSRPDIFNPTGLDTDQWAKLLAEAGMKGMILTAKHHDGMCLWNTSTTAYKIGNGSWATKRVQTGLDIDVVRMAAASAKKYGIKFGVYLSPWDIHRDPAMPKPGLKGTIYDEPQIFGDSSPGDYNALYVEQLTELVTMKLADGTPIELFEVWLDGASGSDTVQTFNWTGFRDVIRQHQPNAVMWGHQGPDARWVGNEDGFTLPTNWHTISRTQDDVHYSGEELELGVRDGRYWTPSESDARIRDGWFYHADEPSKSGAALMDMYMKTVGRSVNLLLDVPPDPRGLIADIDAANLKEFARLRNATLDRNVVTPDLKTSSSSVRAGDMDSYGPSRAIDGREDTYWAMDDDESTGWIELDLDTVYCVDGFIVQEHVALGQRIGGYTIDAMDNGGTYRAVVSNGTSMGYKRIDLLDKAVETSQIRLRITRANAVPLVQNLQVLGSRNCTGR
ncbi:glycoside hydrolase family 29 protein [Apiospora rasikravindrae]|uniref:alpha-L-fucosidase n=1 Tax=Apiospora rasikravindrae TaxID=990691 RepID=A0ABR1RPD3_9PEZI